MAKTITVKVGAESLADVERRLILATLDKFASSGETMRTCVPKAARVLGIGASTVWRKLSKYRKACK